VDRQEQPARARRPNILFLMADQMQGRVLEPEHPCRTPAFDRLAARGVRFSRAYTPNPVCSPARASLMTGLLPHSHGVLHVTHCTDDDQSVLRTEKPHWAQRLAAAGYRTGYFGKWHVERSGDLARFGWQVADTRTRPEAGTAGPRPTGPGMLLDRSLADPEGYAPTRLYAVGDTPAEQRGMGAVTRNAEQFLEEALRSPQPWCCFVSVTEPHDPYVTSREAFRLYDVDALPVPPNWRDDLAGRPGLYPKCARLRGTDRA
jgi:arylsulfatase A-like enzyme